MHSVLRLCGIIVTGFLASPVLCSANTAHVTLACGTCHDKSVECSSCHSEASERPQKALEVTTHLEQKCLSCHDQHWNNKIIVLNQEGTTDDSFKIAEFTLNFAVRNTVDSTVTFTLEDVNILDPMWTNPSTWLNKSSDGRGLILLLNYQAGQGWVSYEVDDINTTENPLRTKITLGNNWRMFPGAENPLDAYLIYGMLIRDKIQFWNGSAYEPISTELLDKDGILYTYDAEMTFTGPDAMAFDESETGSDPTPTGICQVCHQNTTHWQSDGSFANHFSGWDCMICHPHELGFEASPPSLCNIENNDSSMEWDCNSAWGDENPLCVEDCAGVPGGDAILDICGVCNGDSTKYNDADETPCFDADRSGTVTIAELMWQQATADVNDDVDRLAYYDAEDFCSGLLFAGYTDWRLPSKDELKGLVVCAKANGETVTETPLDDSASCEYTLAEDGSYYREYVRPTIDNDLFDACQCAYWAHRENSTKWNVNFITGRAHWSSSTMQYSVRCVRDIE